MIFEILFWFSFALVLYIYAGYYALIWLISRFYPEPLYEEVIDYPPVSVVFSAYNEEKVLKKRVKNCLALDYPEDKLEILIGSDGSTDKTNSILESIHDSRVTIFLFHERHGKNWVLNQLVEKSTGEILVFTDADVLFDTDVVRELIVPFQDKNVGVVGGKVVFVVNDKQDITVPEQKYFAFEAKLRELESRIKTTFSLSGAVLAVKRSLYRNLPVSAIFSDDSFTLLSAVKNGYSAIFWIRAQVFAPIQNDIFVEMKRRIRISAMNLNGIIHFTSLLYPDKGFIALGIWSHKVLRWLSPIFIVVFFVSGLFTPEIYVSSFLYDASGVVLILSLIGVLLSILKIRIKFLTYCAYFLVLNVGLLIGFFKFIFRLQKPYWNPVNRP